MKKGQILEGYIERVDFPNKGFAVVEDEEKKVIVKNTVPEQKVRFAVNKIRKGQAEGRRSERHIAIKWNFLLETNIRTDLLHLACIKEAAFTIL